MIRLLLGLDVVPQPSDATDALAVAICHLHTLGPEHALAREIAPRGRGTSWRKFKIVAGR
jgi:hypothetical protein